MEPPLLLPTSPPVMFNHFSLSVCVPLVILKCLFELAAVSVEYTVSFPVTVKSPETATSSVIVQSVLKSNVPLVSAQFHSTASATPTQQNKTKTRNISEHLLRPQEKKSVKLFETLSCKIFSLQRSFLLLIRLAFPKSVLITPKRERVSNPVRRTLLQNMLRPVAETKSLDPASERSNSWRNYSASTYRSTIHSKKLDAIFFFASYIERIMLPTSRDIVSSVAISSCSSGAFPSGRVLYAFRSRLPRFFNRRVVFFVVSFSGYRKVFILVGAHRIREGNFDVMVFCLFYVF